MQNHTVRWTALIALLSMCLVMALILTPIMAQSDFGQETIDAAVGAYFTQTASAYEDLLVSATARPDYNATQTVMAAFQATVTSQFYDHIVATVHAQETSSITTANALADDLSLATLTVDNLNQLMEIYALAADASVTDAEFSPSSRWLAVGYETGDVTLWDMQTGAAVRTLAGHPAPISALMFSPNEQILVSASEMHHTPGNRMVSNIRIWDYTTGQQLHNLYGHGFSVSAMVLSFDGLRLVTLDEGGTAIVWNTVTGEVLYRIEQEIGSYVAVAYFRFDDLIIIANGRYNLYFYELPSLQSDFLPSGDPTTAGGYTQFRWDIAEQREFYTRRGSLLYNMNFIRAINSDTVRSLGVRLLSIDEANTMMALVIDDNLHVFGVLTGARADAAIEATATEQSYFTATAIQIERDATATAQAIATSDAATAQVNATNRAATQAVADLNDCPGVIVDNQAAILRIVRMEPDLDESVVGALRAGSLVEIINVVENEDGGWYEISQSNRRLGFVPAEYVIIECK